MGRFTHTFVIPAHGDSPYIEECVVSLKNQTTPSTILVSTPVSSKYLENICSKFNIRLAVSNNKASIANDWTYAFSVCDTDFVTLAHQDDIYMRDYTESFFKAVEASAGKAVFIFSWYKELVNDKERSITAKLLIKQLLLFPFLFTDTIKSRFIKNLLFSLSQPIPTPSVMFNKNQIGNFVFSDDFKCNTDWDAWLRLSEMKGTIIYVKKPLMIHRIHPWAQTAIAIGQGIRQREDLAIFSRMWPKLIAWVLSSVYALSIR